ncbi:MAG: Hsp20/alpha crystallin family protein [Treponema sp.]|jgi:HSP20 family protein|nr:Hsp20/alpha crystallin family protein [Treponema sp.]
MKTLTLYGPNAIQNVLNDFDRYFGSFLGDSIAPAGRIFNHLPATDIQETENDYVLDMELPGYDEKNIEVHVDGGNLTIASIQEEQEEKKGEDKQGAYLIKERLASAFKRSFRLPENADPEGVSAGFKNGVLSLHIKKRAETKRSIQINAA